MSDPAPAKTPTPAPAADPKSAALKAAMQAASSADEAEPEETELPTDSIGGGTVPHDGAPEGAEPGNEKAAVEKDTTPADDLEIKIGNETLTFADLKEAYGHIQESIDLRAKIDQREARVNAFVEAFQADPGRVLLDVFSHKTGSRDKGYGALVEFAAGIVEKHLEHEAMPQEAREALRWKTEAETARQQLEAAQKAQKEADYQREVDAAFETLSKEISAAAQGAGLDGNDPDIVAEIAETMDKLEQSGFTADAKKAALRVKKQRSERIAKTISKDTKIEEIPPELIKRIREADLAKVKAGRGAASGEPSEAPRKVKTVRLPERAPQAFGPF